MPRQEPLESRTAPSLSHELRYLMPATAVAVGILLFSSILANHFANVFVSRGFALSAYVEILGYHWWIAFLAVAGMLAIAWWSAHRQPPNHRLVLAMTGAIPAFSILWLCACLFFLMHEM